MDIPNAVAKCYSALEGRKDLWRATVFLAADKTVKVTRRRFQGRIRRSDGDFVLSIGRPNYQERLFLKLCKKSGEPIPVRKVQLKTLPRRKG